MLANSTFHELKSCHTCIVVPAIQPPCKRLGANSWLTGLGLGRGEEEEEEEEAAEDDRQPK
jgi:hypothetical protein